MLGNNTNHREVTLSQVSHLLTNNKTFLFKLIPTLTPQKIILGSLAYYLARLKINNLNSESLPADAKKLLEKGEHYGSFHAIELLIKYDVDKIFDTTTVNPSNILALIHRAQLVASLFWTPGYLLLANVYLHVTQYFNDVSKNSPLSKLACQLALQAFLTAYYLLPFSEPMIYNAYLGEDFMMAVKKRFYFTDEPLNKDEEETLYSWEGVIDFIIQLSDGFINDEIIRYLNQQAQIKRDQLTSSCLRL